MLSIFGLRANGIMVNTHHQNTLLHAFPLALNHCAAIDEWTNPDDDRCGLGSVSGTWLSNIPTQVYSSIF